LRVGTDRERVANVDRGKLHKKQR